MLISSLFRFLVLKYRFNRNEAVYFVIKSYVGNELMKVLYKISVKLAKPP